METELTKSDGQFGLSLKQKDRLAELISQVVQNRASPATWDEIRYLTNGNDLAVAQAMTDGVTTHPDFHREGEVVDNFHKNILIRAKLEEVKSKTSLNDKKEDQISISMLNRMASMAADPKRSTVKSDVIDVSKGPQIKGNDSKVIDND